MFGPSCVTKDNTIDASCRAAWYFKRLATYSYLLRNLEVEQTALDQLRDNRSNAELKIPLLPEHIRMNRHVLPLDSEISPAMGGASLLMLRPSGNVTMLSLLFAYQFTSMLGDVPTDQPRLEIPKRSVEDSFDLLWSSKGHRWTTTAEGTRPRSTSPRDNRKYWSVRSATYFGRDANCWRSER
jgi:hypothetical protein